MNTTSGLVDVGTTKLFHEVHGSGPSLLLITGGTGDAGEWAHLVPVLAEEFTVVTYDRRGFSRSPRPAGWTASNVAEQAEDAAALLRTLDLAPAVVVGHSAGGSIICHWFESAEPEQRARVLDNGAVLFPIEMPWVACFVPDRAGMRATGVPLTVVTGVDNRDTWFGAAAAWLAEGTGANRVELPGGHIGFITHPEAFVALVRGPSADNPDTWLLRTLPAGTTGRGRRRYSPGTMPARWPGGLPCSGGHAPTAPPPRAPASATGCPGAPRPPTHGGGTGSVRPGGRGPGRWTCLSPWWSPSSRSPARSPTATTSPPALGHSTRSRSCF